MGAVYGYASVGRAGLANLMLPWARCEIFCHRHGLRMLAPQWSQFKIGPLLRGERDKRYYMGLFESKTYVRGLAKLAIFAGAKKIDESKGEEFMAQRAQTGGNSAGRTLVVFRDLDGMFKPLMEHRQFLHGRLMEILRPAPKQAIQSDDGHFVIGVHIRRGDKIALKLGQPWPIGEHHYGQPDEWFIACIQNIRNALGYTAPVRIYSDAYDHQLTDVLALPNVHRAPENSAIADILLLAKSKVLITTGTSTFSMWSSLLGQMPTLWYPGLLVNLAPDRPDYHVETSLTGDLPEAFVQVLRRDLDGVK